MTDLNQVVSQKFAKLLIRIHNKSSKVGFKNIIQGIFYALHTDS